MAARLILAERSGSWAKALRVELAATGVRLWEAGPRPRLVDVMAVAPASFLVLELTGKNASWTLDTLVALHRDWPNAGAAVVADRSMAAWEWLIREAGAVHFVTSPRKLGPLGNLVLRHLAQAPLPAQTLRERLWASLPWSEV